MISTVALYVMFCFLSNCEARIQESSCTYMDNLEKILEKTVRNEHKLGIFGDTLEAWETKLEAKLKDFDKAETEINKQIKDIKQGVSETLDKLKMDTDLMLERKESEISKTLTDALHRHKGAPQSLQVNGDWSSWSAWGECSVTCGLGLQTRDRSCTQPSPPGSGYHCVGDARDTMICISAACQDGGWSEWTSWSSCSKTCNGGLQKRSRSCNSPPPSVLGNGCIGDPLEVQECSSNQCTNHYVGFTARGTKALNGNDVTFTTVVTNVGNRYDTSTGTFTCDLSGFYFFSLAVLKDRDVTYLTCQILKNDHEVVAAHVNPKKTGSYFPATTTALVHLDVGDRVKTLCVNGATTAYNGYYSSFTGYLVHVE